MSKDTPKIKVVVIGGGISGIATGIRLSQALGDRLDLTILEKRGSPGGVWRDSKWPGAGVDVPIHLYSLYSDLNPEWDSVYASQPEVLAYWEALIDKHELRDTFLFNNEFVGSNWDEKSQTHTVHVRNASTGTKQKLVANFLISAAGPLVKPELPKIPGVKDFQGPYFHNLRWDPAVQLEGKRVAVIGNGSSGIQLVPGVAALPGVTLTHYIRSGGYFVPKPQRQYTEWEKFAFRWIPGWIHLNRYNMLREHDRSWAVQYVEDEGGHRHTAETELLAYLKEKAPTEYLDALTPNYPLGTKRTALDLGWLDSLHRPNVSLVNTAITHIRPNGIETRDGTLREHDVIIYATGSDVANEGVGVNRAVHGEGDLELKSYWDSIGGPQAFAGIAVPHFPNYFIVIGPNATAGSWGWTLGAQSKRIAQIVKTITDEGLSSIQPREAAFAEHNKAVQERLSHSAAASKLTNNWWRTSTGLITVVNPQSGRELWRQTTRALNWAEWKVERLAPGPKGQVEEVDLGTVLIKRRVREIAVSGAILGLLGWYLPTIWPSASAEFVSLLKSVGLNQ